MPIVEEKQKYGFLIVISTLVVAMTLATILSIAVVNGKRVQDIERAHRVTLCILLTAAENRTAAVVRACRDNPPTLEELPGIAQDIVDDLPSATTTTEGG